MSENQLTCFVCQELYNDSKNAPLALSCGHTFCSSCVSRMHNGRVKCAYCSKDDTRPMKDITRNYIISEVAINITPMHESSDIWTCKSHRDEKITFICKETKQFLCDECLHESDINFAVPIDPQDQLSKLKYFKNLFEITKPFELKERVVLCDLMNESLEGQKMKIIQNLEDRYNLTFQDLKSQFVSYISGTKALIQAEQDRIQSLKEVLTIMAEMKTLGIHFEHAGVKLKENKLFALVTALNQIKDFQFDSGFKGWDKPFEFNVKVESPKPLWTLASSLLDTISQILKGLPDSKEIDEKKISRFITPSNRWGIFEAKNQIEAVTFSTNRIIFMTGIGVGNAFYQDKIVKLEKYFVLKGGSTSSEVIFEGGSLELHNTANSPKIKKISFTSPVKLIENEEYTIKIVLRGGAGVFRGGTTTRIRDGEGSVLFKFKPTIYSGEDVKNGENADDGPIFDIYYKLLLDDKNFVTVSRFDEFEGESEISQACYSCLVCANGQAALAGFNLPAPARADAVFKVEKVEIAVIKDEILVTNFEIVKQELQFAFRPGEKKVTVNFESPFKLEPSASYLIQVVCGCLSAFKPSKFKGPNHTSNEIIIKTKKYNMPNTRDMSQEGPITDFIFQISDTSTLSSITIPPKFLEIVSGETQIQRFETFEKQWHLGSENQVECFSFSFTEDVILTGVGLGNCAKVNSFIVVESIQILSGNSSIGQLVYNSVNRVTLYNSTDENPVIKVRLESQVKISANLIYTIRIVMRGEGKAFKGKKFIGSSLNTSSNITFKCFKAKLLGNDKQNGDNESSGPIFDFYFIPLLRTITVEDYKSFISKLYPKNNTIDTNAKVNLNEIKVTRYNSVGSSWHVNTDGKQIEAISFKASSNLKLSAVGIGNAHEEGHKITVSKIQIKEGKSTQGSIKLYKHKKKEKLINTGEDSKFVRVQLESQVNLKSETWYTLMVKYKPGVPVCRGTMANNQPSSAGITFTFEKTKYEGSDVENGSHEVHGPLKDFYFTLT